MSNIVPLAYADYLRDKRLAQDMQYAKAKKGVWQKGNLWPTDLGKCHRAAILRVTGVSGDDTFTTKGLDYMNSGSVYEDETGNALRHTYLDRLKEQIELKYMMWSGKVDFAIDIGTDAPILIEHKMTSERNWGVDSNTELPKREHIGQLLTYRWLYRQLYGVTPRVILYYKSWGNWAEFELEPKETHIQIIANVNGVVSVEKYEYDVEKEIIELMDAYNNPAELPPRLEKKYLGCTFAGRPSCPYYRVCWGE